MITIYKYHIPLQQQCRIVMPAGAKILAFQAQGAHLFVWAKVDTDKDTVTRTFALEGTGFDLTLSGITDWTYIGTVQLDGFVWHLFERPQ